MSVTSPPLRHALACTDFSAPALQAAERAARIARAQGAALHLLHTVASGTLDELKRWPGADAPPAQAVLAQAEAELQAQARSPADGQVPTRGTADAADRAAAVPLHRHLDTGSVPEQAQRLAEALPAGDKLRFAGVPEDTVAHYRRRARAEALQQPHALAHDLGPPTGLAAGMCTARSTAAGTNP